MILGIDASRANKKEKTGVEWYSYFLIQEFKTLIPKKIKVRLYSTKPLLPDLLPLPDNWEAKVLRWPPRILWTLKRLSWEMLWHKPDILFVPSHILPFFTPKNTFTTIHDIGFRHFPQSYSWFNRFILNFGLWRAFKSAKKIFTPSEFTKNELKSVSKNIDKVVITPLGYDDKKYKLQDISAINSILKKHSIISDYILYVGRKESKKNILNMIKAFENIKSKIKLVLVGTPGFGYQEIKKYIDSSKIKSNILELGWVEEKELPLLMAGAKIFLYPTLYEGFGIPILEAFASQVPIITSNNNSTAEVLGDAGLLVDPQNINDIQLAIEKILNNELLSAELTAKGLEQLKKFSWKNCAEKTLKNMTDVVT